MSNLDRWAGRVRAEVDLHSDLPLTQGVVRGMLDLFLGEIVADLMEDKRVTVDNFGTFLVSEEAGVVSIQFQPSSKLRERLKSEIERGVPVAHEKLGVQESRDDDSTKTAAKKGVCPKCGSALEKTASVHKCPTHGTEPFEQKEEDDATQG